MDQELQKQTQPVQSPAWPHMAGQAERARSASLLEAVLPALALAGEGRRAKC